MQGRIIQLEIPAWDERALGGHLAHLCAMPIEVSLTNNGSTMMSFRPANRREPARLRVHRMFAAAPPEVVEALAQWALGRRSSTVVGVLDGFIAANRHLVQRRPVTLERLDPVGAHHDLRVYYDEVNAREFAGEIDAPITWGRFPAARRRRSIRLGSYTPDDHLIRIHPHLDQDFVPDFFVRYIVFHEMLHAQLGIEVAPSGRRCIHTREFNRRERQYAEYPRAMAWHDQPGNLRRLLRPGARSA